MTIQTLTKQDSFTQLREVFNGNFSGLVEAVEGAVGELGAELGKKIEVVAGSYTGDNQETREIVLGFQPLALLSVTNAGVMGDRGIYGGLIVPGVSNNGIQLTSQGFQVTQIPSSSLYANGHGTVYCYLALRETA